MSSNTEKQPVEVLALVLVGIEHARAAGVDMTQIARVRAACRLKLCYYASAWIGNHQREYMRGLTDGFVALDLEGEE